MREEKSRRRKKAKDSTDILDFYPKVKLFCIKKIKYRATKKAHRKKSYSSETNNRTSNRDSRGRPTSYIFSQQRNEQHAFREPCM
jgi:hypothetical protein